MGRSRATTKDLPLNCSRLSIYLLAGLMFDDITTPTLPFDCFLCFTALGNDISLLILQLQLQHEPSFDFSVYIL